MKSSSWVITIHKTQLFLPTPRNMFSKRLLVALIMVLINGGLQCRAAGFDFGVKGKWWTSGQVGYDSSYPNLLSRSFRETVFNPLVDEILSSVEESQTKAEVGKQMDIAIMIMVILFNTLGFWCNWYQFKQMRTLKVEWKRNNEVPRNAIERPRHVNER